MANTFPSATGQPVPGQPAPEFEAPVVGPGLPEDARLRLSDLRGRPLVLYFYPKDDTPGCTRQACALRDGWQRLSRLAQVVGVSGDSAASHGKFIRKHALPFPLLSDADHAVACAYGTWVEKSLYGRNFMGTERTTFVIGADGRVLAVLSKVKADAHLDQVLAVLAAA
jgi:thioredoxin-dependent peroxiredoxin